MIAAPPAKLADGQEVTGDGVLHPADESVLVVPAAHVQPGERSVARDGEVRLPKSGCQPQIPTPAIIGLPCQAAEQPSSVAAHPAISIRAVGDQRLGCDGRCPPASRRRPGPPSSEAKRDAALEGVCAIADASAIIHGVVEFERSHLRSDDQVPASRFRSRDLYAEHQEDRNCCGQTHGGHGTFSFIGYASKAYFRDNRLHHPLLAFSIALRRRTTLSTRRRLLVLETCGRAADMAGLHAAVRALPVAERDEVLDLLPPPGLRAPAPWEVVALLGKGGMGEAWLCGDGSGGLAVLKTLRPELLEHGQAAERFSREVASTLRLRHRNIVAALGADADAGWMLLEFVAGGDLRAAVQVAGPLGEADALAVAAQVADGLGAMEAASLVHRDVKPANLFVTPEGVIRIADLGLACSASPERTRLTAAGRAVGSYSYMSPEQFSGVVDIDCRSDHFSLGATLVALIAGRTPGGQHDGPLTMTAVDRLIKPTPPLRHLLEQLLQPDRNHRPRHASALQDAIREAIGTVGGHGTVPSLELRSTAARLDPHADLSTFDGDLPTMLLPATATDAAPLSSPAILLGSARSPVRWLVWAGERLVLGKLRGPGVELALRNYPVDAHRDGLEELSRRHAEVTWSTGAAWVRDLGSANGSRLDGATLGSEAFLLALGDEAILDLAGQVILGLRALAGGVVLRRLRNTRTTGYALLGSRLSLGPASADLPWPDAARALDLERRNGRWLLDGNPLRDGPVPGLPQAWARPLELADLDVAEPG